MLNGFISIDSGMILVQSFIQTTTFIPIEIRNNRLIIVVIDNFWNISLYT